MPRRSRSTDCTEGSGGGIATRSAFAILLVCALMSASPLFAQFAGERLERYADIRERIGRAYGVAAFDSVTALRYTFRIESSGRTTTRHWTWEPKSDWVVLQVEDSAAPTSYHRFNRREISSETPDSIRKLDHAFINDNYWFLFPLHVFRDTAASVVDSGIASLPIGSGSARRVVVTYPNVGGYTPGDVYQLFLDDSFRIVQWIYNRGGDMSAGRAMTWEKNQRLGPLVVATEHRNAEGTFLLRFTDLSIKTLDSFGWIRPL